MNSAVAGTQTYTTGVITSTSGTTTPSSTFQLDSVLSQSITSFRENGGSELTQLTIAQQYILQMTMAKPISLTVHPVPFEGLSVARVSQYVYQVTYTPATPAGTRILVLSDALYNDSFIYNIQRSLNFLRLTTV